MSNYTGNNVNQVSDYVFYPLKSTPHLRSRDDNKSNLFSILLFIPIYVLATLVSENNISFHSNPNYVFFLCFVVFLMFMKMVEQYCTCSVFSFKTIFYNFDNKYKKFTEVKTLCLFSSLTGQKISFSNDSHFFCKHKTFASNSVFSSSRLCVLFKEC